VSFQNLNFRVVGGQFYVIHTGILRQLFCEQNFWYPYRDIKGGTEKGLSCFTKLHFIGITLGWYPVLNDVIFHRDLLSVNSNIVHCRLVNLCTTKLVQVISLPGPLLMYPNDWDTTHHMSSSNHSFHFQTQLVGTRGLSAVLPFTFPASGGSMWVLVGWHKYFLDSNFGRLSIKSSCGGGMIVIGSDYWIWIWIWMVQLFYNSNTLWLILRILFNDFFHTPWIDLLSLFDTPSNIPVF